MKRIRLILTLLLCLALICPTAVASAATKAATTVPTLKISIPKGTVRGGIGGSFTVTPSVPGFLTVQILNEDGFEVGLACENLEVHTKTNTITYTACDANGNSLPAGSYTLSAVLINQYGTSSKVVTSKITLGDPKPELTNVSVSASNPFVPTISFGATFSGKSATVSLSLYTDKPSSLFYDDFPSVELTASGMASAAINLKASGNAMATGYYTATGALVEDDTNTASDPITVKFVVDSQGTVYALEEASEDVLASIDQTLADAAAGLAVVEASATVVSDDGSTVTLAADDLSTDSADESVSGTAAASPVTTVATGTVTYTSGVCTVGEEGYEIGVGVSDVSGTDAGYWSLTSSATNEEIWAAITHTMTSVNVDERESAYIYDSPYDGRKSLGTVSGLSQGLNVVAERDDGWSLVEAFRNEDGAFIRGYIRTKTLRTVDPNTTYGIVIDKQTQTLTVWKDGAPIGSCAVTTGAPTTKYLYRETPAGEFITVTRRGTIDYYTSGYCKYTVRINGIYHLCEIPTTKKNGTDYSILEDSLGQKATRGNICIAHDASTDGGINASWLWDMTDQNKKVKVLILDDKERSQVPVGE